jgi:hypothetical protein
MAFLGSVDFSSQPDSWHTDNDGVNWREILPIPFGDLEMLAVRAIA